MWRIGGEVTADPIVVHRWPDFAVLAALLAEDTSPAVIRTDPPRGALVHRLPGGAGLLDEIAVAEFRGHSDILPAHPPRASDLRCHLFAEQTLLQETHISEEGI